MNATDEPARWDLFVQELALARLAGQGPRPSFLPQAEAPFWDLREWGGPAQATKREFFALYGRRLAALQAFAAGWLAAGGHRERIPEELKAPFEGILQGIRPTVREGNPGPGGMGGATPHLHQAAWELWRLQAGQADFSLYRCPGCHRFLEVRP